MTTCPVCGRRAIGKVGSDQYYCWECCVEFMVKGQAVKIFDVQADGTLTQYPDPLQNTVNLQQ